MILGQLFLQRVGYAVHVLCYMAKVSQENRLTSAPELSEWMRRIWPGTSETYLARVIHRLARGGILESQRGAAGGYWLARRVEEISLHDVVAAMEGLTSARCPLTPSGRCPVQKDCDNHRTLLNLQQQYTDLLANISVAELARGMAADTCSALPVARSVSQ